MSSLLFSSDLLAQGDPTRLASRSQAERRVVDRGRVSTAFTAITPSDNTPRAGSEPAAVMSRTDPTPNVVVVLSNSRVGLDQSPFGRAPGLRAAIDPTRATTHFAAAGATSSHSGASTAPASQGPVAANPSSTSAAGDAPADSGIRPMMLAPSVPTEWGGGHFFASDESGGGDPPPDKPPLLEASGGNAVMGSWAAQPLRDGNNQPIAGMYEIPQGVPVGTIMWIQASSPDAGYTITNISWQGGTTGSGYFSSDASTNPTPQTMSLVTGVPTNQISYVFIVGPDAMDYTIQVHVDYSVGNEIAHGDATLTFASKRPTATLSMNNPGQYLFKSEIPFVPKLVSIRVEAGGAQLKAVTNCTSFGGYFMFMQFIDVNRSHTPKGGQQATVSGLNLLDDGMIAPFPPLGMELDAPLGTHGWSVGKNASKTVTATDTGLGQPTLKTDTQLSVNDSLRTYLMYRPVDGVWVALKKLDWTFVGSATSTNAVWPLMIPFPTGTTTESTPSGSDGFPEWSSRTSDLQMEQQWPLS